MARDFGLAFSLCVFCDAEQGLQLVFLSHREYQSSEWCQLFQQRWRNLWCDGSDQNGIGQITHAAVGMKEVHSGDVQSLQSGLRALHQRFMPLDSGHVRCQL